MTPKVYCAILNSAIATDGGSLVLLLKRSDGGIETLLLNRLIASVGADDHNSVFLISGGLTNKERRRVTGKERSDLAAAIEELVNNLPYDDLISKTVAEIVSALLRPLHVPTKVVKIGTWYYDGTIPRRIEIAARSARFASSRFDEDDQLDENAPIPETPDGFVYQAGTGPTFKTLSEASAWADAQPWGPVIWDGSSPFNS